MAVVNTLSVPLQGADASPPLLNQVRYGGNVKAVMAAVAKAASDSAASTLRCVRVPSNAVLLSVKAMWGAAGAGATFDLGVYRTAYDGGAVVDADLIASAVDDAAAQSVWLEMLREAASDVPNINKPVWERGGLTADPGGYLDVVFTLGGTPGANAISLALLVTYLQ